MSVSLNSCNKLSDFAAYDKALNISYNHLHMKSKITSDDEEIIVNTSCIPIKYFDVIKQNLSTVTLTDKEYIEYKYQPKKYCYEKLGSIEIWSLLLLINNMTSATEFNLKTFKVPSSDIFTLLNEMIINETDNIEKNNESIGI